MTKKYCIFCVFLVLYFAACTKEAWESRFQGFEQPSNFPNPVYHFSNNHITDAGFELGRKLFYDPILSANNTISCGSCHSQRSSFTHHGHVVSHGIFDRLGTRNSPPIMNLAWSSSFMWDGGIVDLDLQPIAPITNHVEMDESIENVISKLKASGEYRQQFEKAFDSGDINAARFLKALSQFMLMCVSSNSKYDSVSRGQNVTFSESEKRGYLLFQQKCNFCHAEPLFTDFTFRNNGVVPSSFNDLGRFLISQHENDKYKFKVPSLRNLAFTAPYMHDGRFFTLDAVLDHYSIPQTGNLNAEPQLRDGINFSETDRKDILAFLETLNDKSFVNDKRLAEPK